MNRRLNELMQMIKGSERLELSGALVFDHIDALVARDTIVQSSSCSLQLHGSIGNDLRICPAILVIPINAKHVICESLSENVLLSSLRLDFLVFSLIDFDI